MTKPFDMDLYNPPGWKSRPEHLPGIVYPLFVLLILLTS